MNWKSFLECLPKVGERIVIIHEWCTGNGCIPTKHYTVYECNDKNIQKSFFNEDDRSMVDFINLKMIGGEKLFDYLEKRSFYSKFIHWARLN